MLAFAVLDNPVASASTLICSIFFEATIFSFAINLTEFFSHSSLYLKSNPGNYLGLDLRYSISYGLLLLNCLLNWWGWFGHRLQEVRNNARVDFINQSVCRSLLRKKILHQMCNSAEKRVNAVEFSGTERSKNSSFANWTLWQLLLIPVFWYWRNYLLSCSIYRLLFFCRVWATGC